MYWDVSTLTACGVAVAVASPSNFYVAVAAGVVRGAVNCMN